MPVTAGRDVGDTLAMESSPTTTAHPVANPGRRLGAGLIDILAVLLAGIVYTLTFGSEQPKGSLNMTVNQRVVNDGGVLVFVLLVLVAFFVAEALSGRTLGKALTGLRVTMSDGQPVTPSAVFVRTLIRPIDGLPYVIPNLLGFIVVASSARNQRIGDLVAGTIVVHESGHRESPLQV